LLDIHLFPKTQATQPAAAFHLNILRCMLFGTAFHRSLQAVKRMKKKVAR
jgi:hypothetical protein